MSPNKAERQIIQLAHEQGAIRPRDLAAHGISRMSLQRLYERGELVRSGRGVYMLASNQSTEHLSLAEVCKRVPRGVVCLVSALRFHNIGTQNPHEVWLALSPRNRRPRIDYPPVHVVRFSGTNLISGVEEHRTSDGLVRVYGAAKTVVDCFRYRNKIGLDVALEALREILRERRVTVDELWRYAEQGRAANVMRPYLEALL